MFGGRYIVAIGIGLSSFLGILQQGFAMAGTNWFIMIRFLQGLAQGFTFTAQTSLWGHWSPPNERTILVGISQLASMIGILVGNALSG